MNSWHGGSGPPFGLQQGVPPYSAVVPLLLLAALGEYRPVRYFRRVGREWED